MRAVLIIEQHIPFIVAQRLLLFAEEVEYSAILHMNSVDCVLLSDLSRYFVYFDFFDRFDLCDFEYVEGVKEHFFFGLEHCEFVFVDVDEPVVVFPELLLDDEIGDFDHKEVSVLIAEFEGLFAIFRR
jgi:hypothetical protein